MPLPWQHTFYHCQKMCLAHLHPKANICAKFHENWWKTEEVVRDARFSPNFCHNMPLPWQHTFYHCQKMCLAHLHPKANICAKFHENWWKTEEVVRDARFSPHFCHNMALPWQHTFYHCQKMCLAHLHPKANICAKFHENWWKTEEVVRDARFFPHFCHNMPLPWQHNFYHCQKMCLAHLHPKANICAKFHENWWKTEEVVRDARFPPHFCHNMPLPWQHTFYHCQKMCLAHLHPKANICAKFHENWWKTEEVVRDARFSPHFCHNMPLPWQHSFCHCQKMCLAHLHSKANISAKFHENWWKTEEVVRDARFSPHFCHNMPLPWQHSFCHCRKMCLAHLHSKANISAKFHENWSKTEEVVRDARLATDRPTGLATDRPTGLATDARRHADSYIPPLYTTCMRGINTINHTWKI